MKEVFNYTIKNTPQNGRVVDLMCGPGQLLGKIHKERKDLHITGVDIDSRYIKYARKKHPGITFVRSDSLNWKSNNHFDFIICTGGLHHLPYKYHQRFIIRLSNLLSKGGVCLLADPYIDEYKNEKQRRLAAARLGYEYLQTVLLNNSTDDIVSATIDIMHNDVLPLGEYKTYIRRTLRMTKKYFQSVAVIKTWPKKKSGYGDYCLSLKK